MRLGAVDYIAKPFDHDEMIMVVERILRDGGTSCSLQRLSGGGYP